METIQVIYLRGSLGSLVIDGLDYVLIETRTANGPRPLYVLKTDAIALHKLLQLKRGISFTKTLEYFCKIKDGEVMLRLEPSYAESLYQLLYTLLAK